MLLPKEIENLIKPRTYVKPKLEFGKHIWEWNEGSFGIRPKEENELKFFIKNSIPVLGYLLEEIKKIERVIEKNRSLDKFTLGENVFSPYIHLSHLPNVKDHGTIMYTMEFTWDQQIFVDRHEDIMVESDETVKIENIQRSTYYGSPIDLKWNLGQFFFNEDE